MAANLTPQYLRAEEEYRRAQTPEEELQWLQVMFAEIPKHKASEKMQVMLKTKIADRQEGDRSVEGREQKTGKGHKIPSRRGYGRVIGGPNAGKANSSTFTQTPSRRLRPIRSRPKRRRPE